MPQVRLSGNPYGFSRDTQRLLADRFGQGWYYWEEEVEPEEDLLDDEPAEEGDDQIPF